MDVNGRALWLSVSAGCQSPLDEGVLGKDFSSCSFKRVSVTTVLKAKRPCQGSATLLTHLLLEPRDFIYA